MTVNFSLEQFEGPLDLLLELIEKEELDITEVSLSRIADQFIQYLEKVENLQPELLADFLFVAARLLLIKSRALLPDLEVDDEEELSAEELQFRLKQYKKFRDISKEILQIWMSKRKSFRREFDLSVFTSFYPPAEVSAHSLDESFKGLLKNLARQEKLAETTILEEVSIEERINSIQGTILEKVQVRFQTLLEVANTKLEVIVTFLALLELIKQRVVVAKQSENFEEIFVEQNNTH
ncbi:MAG: segregation/condensation protein A [bacterium]